MWCFVSQPNSVILEVRVDPKSIGQDCLEKVCEFLGISNETDYFGLKYVGSKGEELWLNLRNPIERQAVPPLRFALRVKFWVPPHLLLQDTTRNQFYLHARLDLSEGRLVLPDWSMVIRILALIAQAEMGDFDGRNPPHAFYSQFSGITATDATAKPTDFTYRVMQQHKDFQGMKKSAAQYWLLKQISSLDTFGEEMFYCKPSGNNAVLGVGPHGISVYNANNNTTTATNTSTTTATTTTTTTTTTTNNNNNHNNNNNNNYNNNNNNYNNNYSLNNNSSNNNCNGQIHPAAMERLCIPYTAIQSASSHRRTFRLEYLDSEDKEAVLEVKLDSSQTASGLYRAITEKHAFYSCETVRSAVTAQFIRDLKGTIVSIFNEDSTLGKKYVFDIRRTCREVYDNARRALYLQGAASLNPESELDAPNSRRIAETCSQCPGGKCKEFHDKLTRLLDAMTCKICMDHSVDTAFLPCAHVIACSGCASRCDRCPLCRTDITQAQKIFLPGEFKQLP